MGYVKYLKLFLKDALYNTCTDDQVCVNKNCYKYDYINIDNENEIFLNLDKKQLNNNNESAIFIQTPGDINLNRMYRGIFEYGQYFIIPIMIIFTILNFILLYNEKIYVFLIFNIIFILYLRKMEISCI